VLLLIPTDHCPDHDRQPDASGWRGRLARCLQQVATYLGDAYLAAEGCRGDLLCASPDYFADAIQESRRRRG
jgi:hypothetical protein